MTAPPPWTSWSRSRSAASPSRRPRRPRSGTASASTSSTRPATSTSPSRWSVRCACSTARSCVLDSNQGVEPQTETVWRQGDKYNVPRIVFANKMDKIGADFFQCLKDIVDRLGAKPIAIQLPIGAESNFKGIDRPRAHEGASSGTTRRSARSITTIDIPADLLDQAKEYREKLIEAAVELDDDAHGRLPRRQGAGRGDAQAADPQGRDHRRLLSRCCAARPSRTRACSRCSTRWSTICRRRSTCRRSRASTTRATKSCARRTTRSRCRCSRSRSWTTRSSARITFCRIYSGTLDERHRRAQLDQATARSASAACC